jgi:hypothetical protein
MKYKETKTDSLIFKATLPKEGFRSDVFMPEVFENM